MQIWDVESGIMGKFFEERDAFAFGGKSECREFNLFGAKICVVRRNEREQREREGV